MCVPAFLALPLLGQIGAVTSIVGGVMAAQGAHAAASAQKAAAEYNAKVATIQAQSALDRGDLEAQRVGMKVASIRGQQQATLAANGVDLDSGSPAALIEQTDYFGLQDQATVVNNSRNEAAGYSQRAQMAQAQADSINPAMAGASSLLTSGGQLADRWFKYGR